MHAQFRSRRFGWWSLLVWLSLGIALELLHGCKLGWYLDAGNETRRLLLRLAHAHGVLLAMANLVFASSLHDLPPTTPALLRAGLLLRWAAILVPLGFLVGGWFAVGGDPGLAIVLVPIGALCLFVAVLTAARLASVPR